MIECLSQFGVDGVFFVVLCKVTVKPLFLITYSYTNVSDVTGLVQAVLTLSL